MPAPAFLIVVGMMLGIAAPLLAAPAGPPTTVVPAEAPLPSRGLVIVLRPPEVDEMTRMALARINGELSAARFRVQVMPLDPSRDPSPQVESVASDAHPVAVFAIAHITDRDGDTIAIWVSDRVGRRTTIQRMAIRGENIKQDAEVLALEAIELIRVSIAGLWPAARPAVTVPAPVAANPAPAATSPTIAPAPTAPAPVSPPPSPTTSPVATADAQVVNTPASAPAAVPPWIAGDRPEIAVGVGVAGLRDSGGQSMQWLGALTAMARWRRGFAARASLAGLGSSATLTGVGGTADVHQILASLGAAWFWSLEGPADVYLLGALGAARLATSGASTDPIREMHNGSAWALTGAVGLGMQVRLGQRVSLAAGAELMWAWARLDVQIADSRTSALLRPAGLFTLALQASF